MDCQLHLNYSEIRAYRLKWLWLDEKRNLFLFYFSVNGETFSDTMLYRIKKFPSVAKRGKKVDVRLQRIQGAENSAARKKIGSNPNTHSGIMKYALEFTYNYLYCQRCCNLCTQKTYFLLIESNGNIKIQGIN